MRNLLANFGCSRTGCLILIVLGTILGIFGIFLGNTSARGYVQGMCRSESGLIHFNLTRQLSGDEFRFNVLLDFSDGRFEGIQRWATPGIKTVPPDTIYMTIWVEDNISGDDVVWHGEISVSRRCDTSSSDDSPPPAPPPLNECLGINEEEFHALLGYTPEVQEFEVDDIFYPYGGQLSFLVPQEASWSWVLKIDGVPVLMFEQTEDTPCQIMEEY